MRGCITSWKDDRGFGFIEPESGSERVFFHISAMARSATRPAVGDLVSFEVSTSAEGRMRAVNVRPVGLAAISGALTSKRVVLSATSLLVFPLVWCLVTLGKIQPLMFWVFAGMSAVAFFLYGRDKWAAKRNAQRTPENILQVCALLGGWPGALLAQQVFRHKSSKRSFQMVFWITVAVNCGALGWLASPTGVAFVRQFLDAR